MLWLEHGVLSGPTIVEEDEEEDVAGAPLENQPLPAGHAPPPQGFDWSDSTCECYFGAPSSDVMSGHQFSPYNDSGNWVRPVCHMSATWRGCRTPRRSTCH